MRFTKDKFLHSVYTDDDSCVGCINCLKTCPTEAIRVHGGKSIIIADHCIDCGECIRKCTHHARHAARDSIEDISNYEFTVALPAPSLYAQFNNLDDVNIVLNSILDLGFDRVFEVSGAAELISEKTRTYINNHKEQWPILSSACPTVVRLIRANFPSLIPHLLPFKAPVELAARIVRRRAMDETGLPSSKIGIFFISPCPAKVSEASAPAGAFISEIDKVLAISDVYPLILQRMNKNVKDPDDLVISGKVGMGWGITGGEAAGVFEQNIISADGLDNVIRVLEDIEDGKFITPVKFIELNACPSGCVGGTFTVENPFYAAAKLRHIKKYLPVQASRCNNYANLPDVYLEKEIKYEPVYSLGEDFAESMKNVQRVERLMSRLPLLDCGACGSPTCRSLAEDVVRGHAVIDDCIYNMKDSFKQLILINSQLMKGDKKDEGKRDKKYSKGNNGK